MLEVKVRGVGIDPKTMSTVLLLSSGEKILPIFIGVAEATAIASELEGSKSQRPQTHDLFLIMLERLKSKIEKVIISDVKDNTYFAVMTIVQEGAAGKIEIDARPSDAVALALKSKAPIYLSENLANELILMEIAQEESLAKEPIDKDEIEAFKHFLDEATPEEWERFLKK